MDMPRVGKSGQIVLPNWLLEALHLAPGDRVAISVEGERAVLTPVHLRTVPQLRGILATDRPVDPKTGRREYEAHLVEKWAGEKSNA